MKVALLVLGLVVATLASFEEEKQPVVGETENEEGDISDFNDDVIDDRLLRSVEEVEADELPQLNEREADFEEDDLPEEMDEKEQDEEDGDDDEAGDEHLTRLSRLLGEDKADELKDDSEDENEEERAISNDLSIDKRGCSNTLCGKFGFINLKCCPGKYCSKVRWCRSCGLEGKTCGLLKLNTRKCCPGYLCKGIAVKKCRRCRKAGQRCTAFKKPCCPGTVCKGVPFFRKCRTCRKKGQRCSAIKRPCCPGLKCRGVFRRRCK